LGTSRKVLLTPKDLSFVGYTYKNFDAIKGATFPWYVHSTWIPAAKICLYVETYMLFLIKMHILLFLDGDEVMNCVNCVCL